MNTPVIEDEIYMIKGMTRVIKDMKKINQIKICFDTNIIFTSNQ